MARPTKITGMDVTPFSGVKIQKVGAIYTRTLEEGGAIYSEKGVYIYIYLFIYTIYSTNIHRLFLSCWCLSMVGLTQILKASWTQEIVMVWNSPLVNENNVSAMTFSGILFCGSWTTCQVQAKLMECLRIPSGVNFLWGTWRSSQVPHHSVGLARICRLHLQLTVALCHLGKHAALATWCSAPRSDCRMYWLARRRTRQKPIHPHQNIQSATPLFHPMHSIPMFRGHQRATASFLSKQWLNDVQFTVAAAPLVDTCLGPRCRISVASMYVKLCLALPHLHLYLESHQKNPTFGWLVGGFKYSRERLSAGFFQ